MTHPWGSKRDPRSAHDPKFIEVVPELVGTREVACISNFDRRESVERMKTIALSEAKTRFPEIVDTLRRDLQDVATKSAGSVWPYSSSHGATNGCVNSTTTRRLWNWERRSAAESTTWKTY